MFSYHVHSGSQSHWNKGVGVSTLFHLLVILGLSMIIKHQVTTLPLLPDTTIETRWSPSAKKPEPVSLNLNVMSDKKNASSGGAVTSILPPVLDLNSAPDPQSFTSVSEGALPQITQHEETLTTKNAADVVGAILTSSGFGNSHSGAGNSLGGGDFFGLNPKSKKIVYVVDSSKSMNFPHESVGKTRLGRVKLELANSILSMNEDQKFFVIFFSDIAKPMPARQLQSATRKSKQKFLSWVARIPGVGTTEPLEALILALRLQPDTIYFLTDGNFSPSVVKAFNQVAEKTHRNQKIIVNGVCLGNREGEKLIRELTEKNSGNYTFIP